MKNGSKPNGFKKEIKSKSTDRADYSKANKRREEPEDLHKFEDFNSFVKETGWKKTNSKSTKVGGKSTGTKTPANYGTKTGAKYGTKPGANYAAKTGSYNAVKADAETGTKNGTKSDTRTGTRTDARSGAWTDTRMGTKTEARTGARVGAKTGGYVSSRTGARTGTKPSESKGEQAGYRGAKKASGSEVDQAEQLKISSMPRRAGSYQKEARIQDAMGRNRTTERKGRDNRDNQKQGRYEQDNQKQGRYDKDRHMEDGQETKATTWTRGACNYQRECGSCNIQTVSYSKHLTDKQKEVDTLLKKYCKVEPIIGMKQPDHYRYKVHAVFDHDRKGNPISGVYEEGTHRVISVDKCLIHNEKADAIIASIRGMLKSFKILTYDEDTGYGLIRHVLIRSGYHSGEIMVVLVLASPIMPSKNNFVKALRAQHPEITTVVVNVNDKQTSMVLGDKEQVLYGKGYIEDSLCGKTFRISPKSFYQVNPVQTEILYQKAIELAKLSGTETVIDAYSGIGTIGLIASDKAKQVIGIELNKDAVRDAIVNAKRNEADNIEFFNNDAGEFMSQMATKGESADVVFMDPPRTGSNPQFMDAVAVLKPSSVVYISCNPISLARDLEYLTKKGYKAQTAIPIDMFPWTGHVEVITLLQKA